MIKKKDQGKRSDPLTGKW